MEPQNNESANNDDKKADLKKTVSFSAEVKPEQPAQPSAIPQIPYSPMLSFSAPPTQISLLSTSPVAAAPSALSDTEKKNKKEKKKQKGGYRDSHLRRLRLKSSTHHVSSYLNQDLDLGAYSSDPDTDPSDDEMDGSYLIEPSYSAFAELLENEPLWEKMRFITEEQEQKLMNIFHKRMDDDQDDGYEDDRHERKSRRTKSSRHASADEPDIKISRDMKGFLKRNCEDVPFWSLLEDLIETVNKETPPFTFDPTPHKEYDHAYIITAQPDSFYIHFTNGFNHIAFRYICTYYGLTTQSTEDPAGRRATLVQKPKSKKKLETPKIRIDKALFSKKSTTSSSSSSRKKESGTAEGKSKSKKRAPRAQ